MTGMLNAVSDKIIVGDVYDFHDCNGRKFIDITDLERSDFVKHRFRMTSSQMLPFQKLMLSSVLPGDEVIVTTNIYNDNSIMVGEYIDNLSNIHNRMATCRCGSGLLSDGFDVYCPNVDCGITLATRLERLGTTTFFPHNVLCYDSETRDDFIYSGLGYDSTPFKVILDPKFWGYEFENIDTILIKFNKLKVSLSTFLIEPLFTDFIDCVKPAIAYNPYGLQGVGYFFGYMSELINRRDYSSESQNTLIKNFIWSLGIQSLRQDTITKMLVYETGMGAYDQVLLPYLHLLTNPDEMVRELQIHRMEAMVICNEVAKRRYELCDIFSHYCGRELVDRFFKRYMR